MPLFPCVSFALSSRVRQGCVVPARLGSGQDHQVIYVTPSNKLLVQNSELTIKADDEVRCLSTIRNGSGRDILLVGTSSRLFAYDAFDNATVFTKLVPDGVYTIKVANWGSRGTVILCGGHCALWGFDIEGNEKYWTVAGDAVRALCLADVDGDGELELVAGSADFELRIFKDDLMRFSMSEADAVTTLHSVETDATTCNMFVYGLGNGTVGAYRGQNRLWRIKARQAIINALSWPQQSELVACVWTGGKVDIRSLTTGDVVEKTQMSGSQPIAAAFVAQLEGENPSTLVAVAQDGRLCGWSWRDGAPEMSIADESSALQHQMHEFSRRKHALLLELSNYEQDEAKSSASNQQQRMPAATRLDSGLRVNFEHMLLEMWMATTHDMPIQAAVVFGEGCFANSESFVYIPPSGQAASNVSFPIRPLHNASIDLFVKAMIGRSDAESLHIFELSQMLPRFARWGWLEKNGASAMPQIPQSASFVEFNIPARLSRMHEWLVHNFVIPQEVIEKGMDPAELHASSASFHFVHLDMEQPLRLVVQCHASEPWRVSVDSAEMAASVVQSLADFFNVIDLSSRAVFPSLFDQLRAMFQEMRDLNDVKSRLTAELAEQTTAARALLLRAEDARINSFLSEARTLLLRLGVQESSVRQSHSLMAANHERLVLCMRRTHIIIQQLAGTRVGQPQRAIVAACRTAIGQQADGDQLASLLENGVAVDDGTSLLPNGATSSLS